MDERRDFVVPDAPQRRSRTRATVRVLVLDDQDRILLLCDSDPGTGSRWWITPGGGIDAGESEVAAVVRELAEETGLSLDAGQVVGPLARRHVLHGYSDQVVHQDDSFYAVRVPAFEVDTSGYTEEEKVTMLESRWWPVAELGSTAEDVWPAVLPRLLKLLRNPDDWPVALEDVEESSVPIGPVTALRRGSAVPGRTACE